MAYTNNNYLNVNESYLFSTIAKKVSAFTAAHPDKKVIRMGIGDVTLPLSDAVCKAMHKAVDEMNVKETFRGYGPEQGYDFLREAISKYYMTNSSVVIDPSEVFVSDGAKSDLGNITDIFSNDNTILIPDPVYPVYVDSNVMLGRKIVYVDASEENDFLPMPPKDVKADIIYLCSPNNPTGAVYTKSHLKAWVEYALSNDAIILFDAAYEHFIGDKDLPRSIYEIDGAKKCAIEFCSFSKTAGFTGTRCGYTIVPEVLKRKTKDGREMSLRSMWTRRQTTKFNGVPYIIQRGAEAVFSEKGQAQIDAAINYYKENARIIADTLSKKNVYFIGGINSPYIWMKCPGCASSWDFFDMLLEKIYVVGTPGVGFGKNGEGFFRLTAFSTKENTTEAMERLSSIL